MIESIYMNDKNFGVEISNEKYSDCFGKFFWQMNITIESIDNNEKLVTKKIIHLNSETETGIFADNCEINEHRIMNNG